MIKIIKQKDLTDIPDYSESKKEDDGQPRDNFYVPTIMQDIDVIENILDKFSKAGVTHKFSGDDLIITALTTSHLDQEKVIDDLRYTLNDVVQQLKKLYKEATGKTLSIEKERSSFIDAVSNYTTGHMGLYKVTNTYELPNSPSSDDKSLEKHELNENESDYFDIGNIVKITDGPDKGKKGMVTSEASSLNYCNVELENGKEKQITKKWLSKSTTNEAEGYLAPKNVKCPKCGNRTGSGNSGGDIEDEGMGNWYCNACGKTWPKR